MQRLSAILCSALLATVCTLASAQVKVGDWTPAFIGVDQTSGSIAGPDASVFYVLRIDLQAEGVSIVGAPHAGNLDTVSETTSQFLKEYKLQAAINGGFFSPCCVTHPEEKHVVGLSISGGKVVSKPTKESKAYTDILLITRDNKAEIVPIKPSTDLSQAWTALTGSALIVKNGKNNGNENKLNKADTPNPRTAVGVSDEGRYLYLVVIDGRKPKYSIGTTNSETAEIMLALHVQNALNLDGGGSTTMVKSNGKGGAILINKPSAGEERYNGSQLGVRALPLPK